MLKLKELAPPAQLQTLVKSCQLSSMGLSRSYHHQPTSQYPESVPNFFATASCTQSVKMFCEKIGSVVLRVHSTHGSAKKIDQLRTLLLIAVAFAAFAYSSGSEISFWKFTCGPSMFAVPIGYDSETLERLASTFTPPARVGRAVCSSFPCSEVQLPGSPVLRESACILSSSALLCFLLVPIVLRELVVACGLFTRKLWLIQSSITVERLTQKLCSWSTISGIFAESWVIGWSPTVTLRIRSSLFSLLQDWLGKCVKLCCSITILFRKEHCTSVCTKITPVLPSHIVSSENPYCVSDRQSPPRSLWEKVPPSSRNHSVCLVWYPWSSVWALGCVLTIIEQLVPSLLFPLRELRVKRLFSFLLGNLDACDFVRQASELENLLLARDWSRW